MNFTPLPTSQPAPSDARPPASLTGTATGAQRRAEDRQFTEMQGVFLASGGLATADHLADLLRRRAATPISVLERWLAQREVVIVRRRDKLLVPLFQFDTGAMCLLPGMTPVLHELRDVFDDWDLAQWFATPNAWTDHVAPAFMVCSNSGRVCDAARCDRFLVRG